MAESIGLDFGTTYSVVAKLKEVGNNMIPDAIDFNSGGNSITSMETLLVLKDDEKPRIGYEAAGAIDDGVKVYSGFKLLLNSNDKKMLKQRGFINDLTPEKITEIYLKELFKKVRKAQSGFEEIQNVVVGVPLVWTQNGEDTRKYEVANIVKRATGANIVEFMSEPTLACAYFVDEINKKREENYEGYILVIDYGGGTLDITLCKVTNENDQSTIEVCDNWGRGENTEGRVGNAGLSFMETVADILIKEQGLEIPNKHDPEYQRFKKDVERKIKEQTDSLKENFKKDRYAKKDGERYGESICQPIYYRGEQCRIKYGTLVEAYDSENGIREILDATLKEAKRDMDENGIPYDDYLNGTFKIATIGGFCNFALTERQIRNDTDWLKSHHNKLDTRYTELDECVSPKNRELAIAYGAALNANNIIAIKKQFPYTLCFYAEMYKKDENGNTLKIDGKEVTVPDETEEFVIFREMQEYEPGKPVFLDVEDTDENDNIILRHISVSGEEVPYIRRKKKNSKSKIKKPAKEMKLPNKKNEGFYLAIAMEKNENLTMYVYDKTIFDTLTEEEKDNPLNKALVGNPLEFPNIDRLLGTFYISQ